MKKPSVLPEGVTLAGAIEGDTDLVIRGRVEGPVRVGGILLIDESGVVRGHVHARSLTVRGVLKGNAFGDEIVRIEASARVIGDLTAPRVRVVRGARFRGQVHMGEVGEPVLAAYDARMHTFTGAPAPAPEPATRELMARIARQASGLGDLAPFDAPTLAGTPAPAAASPSTVDTPASHEPPEHPASSDDPPGDEGEDPADVALTIPAPPPSGADGTSARVLRTSPPRHLPSIGRASAERRSS